jgi:(1->4)-alpha-D-glucan 1-alpha-D-glucosylmutase
MRINASARNQVQGEPAPDRSDEYLYYQTLLGAWPPGETNAGPEFVSRISQYLTKAAKEKKLHTSWITPYPLYDSALAEFVERSLTGSRAAAFLAEFLPFQRRLAELGMMNSLSQLTLKIASPGVPDFFQGSEVWDLNLVDPDNRRPVDFSAHQEMLAEINLKLNNKAPCCAKLAVAEELLADWADGGIKLWLTSQGLLLRRRKEELFLQGEYIPLAASGVAAGNVVAFARKHGSDSVVAVAPRLITGLTGFDQGLSLAEVWGDTELHLPGMEVQKLQNAYTGETFQVSPDGRVALKELFRKFPVALLIPSDNS